jgi:phage minor structural protein
MEMVFVLDKLEKMVGVLSNKAPFSCPFFNDLHVENIVTGVHSYQFSAPSSHEMASKLEVEGFVIIKDLDNKLQMFKIKDIEEEATDDGNVKTVFAEHVAIPELIGNIVRPQTLNGRTLAQAVNVVIGNTGWNMGTVDFSGTKDIVFENFMTSLEALLYIVEVFEVEIQYEIIFENGKVKDRLIHLGKRGTDLKQRFSYSRDIQDVKRKTNSDEVITALIGIGKSDEDGNRVTLQDFDVSSGQTPLPLGFQSPYDVDYIYSEEALQKYSKDGKHIFGIFIDEKSTTKQSLFKTTLNELQRRMKPQVSYEMKIVTMERIVGYSGAKARIGDSIIVDDSSFNPRILVDARIIEVKRSYTEPENDELVLGDYKPIRISNYDSIEKLQQLILLKESTWNKTGITETEVNTIVDTKVEPVSTKIDTVETEVGTVKTDLSNTNTKVNTVESDLSDTKTEVGTISTKVGSIETSVGSIQDDVSDVQTEVSKREYAIIKEPDTPVGNYIVGALWLDNDDILYRYDGTTWRKIIRTTPSEIGAVAKSVYDAKVLELNNNIQKKLDSSIYTTKISELETSIADKVDAEFVNGQLVVKADASDVYTKVETDNKLGAKSDKTNTYTKTEVNNALNSKVSTTTYTADMDGVITDLDSHETRITQTETEIASKVSSSSYNQKVTELEGTLSDKADAVDVYTKTETDTKLSGKASTGTVSAIETRLSDAETSITQTDTAIGLKANKTDVYTKTEVNTSLSGKADNSTVNAIETRVDEAEAELTVQAGQIASKVAKTTYDTKIAEVTGDITAIETRVGDAETRITQTETGINLKADKTTVYTKTETDTKVNAKANQSSLNTTNSNVSSLTTRMSSAEAELDVQAEAISLKASKSDLDSATGRLDEAEAELVVQAGQIASKVSSSEFESLEIGARNLFKQLQMNSDVIEEYKENNTITLESPVTATKSIAYATNDDVYESGTYTFSFYVRNSGTGGGISAIRISKAVVGSLSFGTVNYTGRGASPTGEWEKVTYTFTLDGSYRLGFQIYNHAFTEVFEDKVEVRELKLEKGNKATDWTPAPEDVNALIESNSSRISDAETRITQTESSISLKANASTVYTKSETDTKVNAKANQSSLNTTNSNVSSLTTRVSSAESELSVQAGQIASKVSSTEFSSFKTETGDATSFKIDTQTITTSGWYRIASNVGNRAFAKFTVVDEYSGKHSTATFNASIHYGNNPSVTLLGYGNYSSQAFTKARIVRLSTYDKPYLEIYVVAPAKLTIYCSDNVQVSGWDKVNLTEGAIPDGYTSTDFDINASNVVDVTGQNTAKDTANVNGVPSSTVTTKITNAESSITQLSNQITSKVSQSTYDADIPNLKTRMSSAESTITQQAGQITSKVSTTDYTGNKVASMLNQTATTIKLDASKIELNGKVKFTDLDSSAQGTINGKASQSSVDTINGKLNSAVTTIDGSGITVKDGSFFLEDSISSVKYSVVSKRNMLLDHGFELSNGSGYNSTYRWFDYDNPIGSLGVYNYNKFWYSVGVPKITQPNGADGSFNDAIFGQKSMVVNSSNYVYQGMLGLSPSTTYTVSAFFKRHGSGGIAGGSPSIWVKQRDEFSGNVMWSSYKNFSAVPSNYSTVRYSHTFTLPSNYTDGDGVSFEVCIQGTNGSWVQVDGIQMVEGSYPVLYDSEDTTYSLLNGKIGFLGILDMQNSNIDNVNALYFNDAGGSEGIFWKGGHEWRIVSSPDDLSNSDGPLQIASGNTRRATFGTTGNFYITGSLFRIQGSGGSYEAEGELSIKDNSGGGYLSIGKDSTSPYLQSRTVLDRTYSYSSNMYITGAGTIGRSTSALKYKTDVQDVDSSKFKRILDVSPRTWFDKSSVETYADYLTKTSGINRDGSPAPIEDIDLDEEDVPFIERVPGMIAEEVIEAGLEDYVLYGKPDKDGNREVEGLMYDRLWTLLVPIIKEQQTRIEELERKLI